MKQNFPLRKLSKPALIYRDCMSEVKQRYLYVGELFPKFISAQNEFKKKLILEAIALQYRKIIELIAFASISANDEEYLDIRSNAGKDWNAKLIFKDISRLNHHFYPKPFKISPDETSKDINIIDPIENGFLKQEEAINLYDRCGSLLHAENRFGSYIDSIQQYEYLLSIKEKLYKLLERFEVYLIPERHRYWVELFLNSTEEVRIYGAEVG
jgi:hypothetical protein